MRRAASINPAHVHAPTVYRVTPLPLPGRDSHRPRRHGAYLRQVLGTGEHPDGELHCTWFAGGGGSTEGAEAAGVSIDYALNHDAIALRLHEVNHPAAVTWCADAFAASPLELEPGRPIGSMWFSPDCTHHSKARGAAPKSARIRGLAWCVIPWAKLRRPGVIFIENVEEFQDWGPLDGDGQSIKARKGETFRLFNKRMAQAGYVGEWRELVTADYSDAELAPLGGQTTRKRLFAIFRCDGEPIVWPERTHAPADVAERLNFKPYCPASSFLDFSQDCPSIFLTQAEAKAQGKQIKRPLVKATHRRIAHGIKRHVIETGEPCIVQITHQSGERVYSVRNPINTVTGANRGEFALVSAHLHRSFGSTVSGRPLSVPHPSVMTEGAGAKSGVVACTLDRAYGKSAPASASRPIASQSGHAHDALIAASIVTYYGTAVGSDAKAPLHTVTGEDRHGLVSAWLEQANTGMVGHSAKSPVSTIVGRGTTQRLIEARLAAFGVEPGSRRRQVLEFLWEEFGAPTDDEWTDPVGSPSARLKFGLVILDGQVWQIVDIGMRMLTVRELFSAQTFRSTYIVDRDIKGRRITTTQATLMCGNAVPPLMAKLLYGLNVKPAAAREWREAA